MKLTCPKSGIRYTTSTGFGSASAEHPIFQLPLPKLLNQHLPAFIAGKLEPVETHLFGSAVLAQLPVDRWNCPLQSPETLASIWQANIVWICKTVSRHTRDWEELPKYRITRETADLHNLPVYLEKLNECLDSSEWRPTELKQSAQHKEVTERLFVILRTTDQTLRARHRLPALIANWAAVAGKFPKDFVTQGERKLPLAEFWKSLIVTAFSPDSVAQLLTQDVKLADYEELLEHCEQEISFGQLHTDVLLEKLRNAIDTIKEFKHPKILSVTVADFMREEESTDTGNVNGKEVAFIGPVIPAQKPDKIPPVRHQFKSELEYQRARIKWSAAVTEWKRQNPGDSNAS